MRVKKDWKSKELNQSKILILGIGNTLMRDEGVGVHIVRRLAERKLPNNVTCLDGGTGSFTLLEPMQNCDRILIVDATINDKPAGSVEILYPKYSSDYPPSLTAHDIGLKDLLDVFYLMEGKRPEVTLFAISVKDFQSIGMEISEELESNLQTIEDTVFNSI